MWVPEKFSGIQITADETRTEARPARKSGAVFFSGGLDSTHLLFTLGRRDPAGWAVTIHGADYRPDDSGRFRQLIRKTDSLLQQLNYHRITVRTNAKKCVGRGDLLHGFTLAACAFLLSDLFNSISLAADSTWHMEMANHPFGTNHVTNKYFIGSDFAMISAASDVSRMEKVEQLANYSCALQSLSFCKTYSTRPNNCGKCRKCIRTKAMFIAAAGACPPIFVDNSLSADDLAAIDIWDRVEFPFVVEIYQHAKARGRLEMIPGLEQLIGQRKDASSEQHSRLTRAAKSKPREAVGPVRWSERILKVDLGTLLSSAFHIIGITSRLGGSGLQAGQTGFAIAKEGTRK
jgi:hypothetical protein